MIWAALRVALPRQRRGGRLARWAAAAVLAAAGLWAPPAAAQPPAPAPTPGAAAASGLPPPVVTPLAGPGGVLPGQVRLPAVAAEAFLLADVATGQVLASRNPAQPRAMASTTKVMTALLVVEGLDLGQVVTIGPAPAEVGGAGLQLRAGERLTVGQLLTGLLVRSANDAAVALAEAADGSVGAFVHRMNDRARRLGLTHTRYTNPHGLDQRGHHTSARDLARLWLAALADPTFAELVGTRTAQVPGPAGVRQLTNTNELLGGYRWVDGGKTGFTDAAGRCLVVSAERGGRQLVAVVLGSPDAFVDARALLEHGFGGYVRARVATAGDVIQLPEGSVRTLDDVDALIRRDLLGQTALTVVGPPGGAGAAPTGSLTAGEQVIGPVAVASGARTTGGGAGGAGVPVPVEAVPVPMDADPTIIDPFLGVQSEAGSQPTTKTERPVQRGD